MEHVWVPHFLVGNIATYLAQIWCEGIKSSVWELCSFPWAGNEPKNDIYTPFFHHAPSTSAASFSPTTAYPSKPLFHQWSSNLCFHQVHLSLWLSLSLSLLSLEFRRSSLFWLPAIIHSILKGKREGKRRSRGFRTSTLGGARPCMHPHRLSRPERSWASRRSEQPPSSPPTTIIRLPSTGHSSAPPSPISSKVLVSSFSH